MSDTAKLLAILEHEADVQDIFGAFAIADGVRLAAQLIREESEAIE